MEKKDISMSRKEWTRLEVVEKVLKKQMTQRKAANILGLSGRQVRRIVKRVQREGPIGIIHHSRNRPSLRKIPEQLKKEVINLYQETYSDFGPTLFQEKLLEREGIQINRETLRKWLIEKDLWKRNRKFKEHRHWRERKTYPGDNGLNGWFSSRLVGRKGSRVSYYGIHR